MELTNEQEKLVEEILAPTISAVSTSESENFAAIFKNEFIMLVEDILSGKFKPEKIATKEQATQIINLIKSLNANIEGDCTCGMCLPFEELIKKENLSKLVPLIAEAKKQAIQIIAEQGKRNE